MPLQKIFYKSENVFVTIILLLEGDFKMKEKEFYKEQIIEMVREISNARFLTIIYDFVKPIYEKKKSED